MGLKDRVPSVCSAMTSIQNYRFEITKGTESRKSTTKTIKYYLVWLLLIIINDILKL